MILRNFRWFFVQIYMIFTQFYAFFAIFCQAQIFCCQAPKTILHPWPDLWRSPGLASIRKEGTWISIRMLPWDIHSVELRSGHVEMSTTLCLKVGDFLVGDKVTQSCWGNEKMCWGSETSCWGNGKMCWGSETSCWGSDSSCWGSDSSCWGNEVILLGKQSKLEMKQICWGSDTKSVGEMTQIQSDTSPIEPLMCIVQF